MNSIMSSMIPTICNTIGDKMHYLTNQRIKRVEEINIDIDIENNVLSPKKECENFGDASYNCDRFWHQLRDEGIIAISNAIANVSDLFLNLNPNKSLNHVESELKERLKSKKRSDPEIEAVTTAVEKLRAVAETDPEALKKFVFDWAIMQVCARIDVVSKNIYPFWTLKLFIDLHGVTPCLIHKDNKDGILQCTSNNLHNYDNDIDMVYTLSSIVNAMQQ